MEISSYLHASLALTLAEEPTVLTGYEAGWVHIFCVYGVKEKDSFLCPEPNCTHSVRNLLGPILAPKELLIVCYM
jgi:hypothetical protein